MKGIHALVKLKIQLRMSRTHACGQLATDWESKTIFPPFLNREITIKIENLRVYSIWSINTGWNVVYFLI